MKKSLVAILALCSMALSASAQGTMVIDSGANYGDGSGPTATTGGLVWLFPGILETNDINLGVLWGTSASSVDNVLNLDPDHLNSSPNPNWLASQPTGMGDMTSYGGGAIFDPNGNGYVVPGVAAGTTIWLVLQGWTGNATSLASATGAAGWTAPFSITLAANTSPIQPDIRGMGALVIGDPEPSIPALSALATIAFALFRPRK